MRKAKADLEITIKQIKVSEELVNFGKRKPYKKYGVVQYQPLTPTERTGEEAKLATNQSAKIMIENDIKQL